jgi:hypothetical protein
VHSADRGNYNAKQAWLWRLYRVSHLAAASGRADRTVLVVPRGDVRELPATMELLPTMSFTGVILESDCLHFGSNL